MKGQWMIRNPGTAGCQRFVLGNGGQLLLIERALGQGAQTVCDE